MSVAHAEKEVRDNTVHLRHEVTTRAGLSGMLTPHRHMIGKTLINLAGSMIFACSSNSTSDSRDADTPLACSRARQYRGPGVDSLIALHFPTFFQEGSVQFHRRTTALACYIQQFSLGDGR